MATVIEVGGKQYCLTPGQKLRIDRIDGEAGATVRFQDLLANKPVEVTIVEHSLGDKVVSRKFRNKSRYQRVRGHRQPVTVITLAETAPKRQRAEKAGE